MQAHGEKNVVEKGAGNLVRLGDAAVGRRLKMVKADVAGSAMELRLVGMGLIRGVKIELIRNDFTGPVILLLNNNRLILGRGMANKVMVEEV